MKYLCLILVLAAQLAAGATIPARSISVDTNTVAFSSDRLQPVLDYLGTQVFAWTNPSNGITQAAGDLRWMGISNYDGITIGTNASGRLMWMNPANSIGTTQITNGAVTFDKLAATTTNMADNSTNTLPTTKTVKDYTDAAQASAVASAQGFVNLFAETNYFMAVYSVTTGTAVASFPANVWTQRMFNTVYTNTMENYVSLSSNNFIVSPGTYYVRASSPSGPGIHRIVLYNRTTGAMVIPGEVNLQSTSHGRSALQGRFSITSTNILAIDHYNTAASVMGYAAATGWGNQTNIVGGVTNIYSNINMVYSEFELWKIK